MERTLRRRGKEGDGEMKKLLTIVAVFLLVSFHFSNALVYGILDEPKALNVWVDYGPNAITWSKYVFSHKYRSLYRFAHVTYDFVPDLAADYPRKYKDGEFYVYEVTLRNGIKWSDGSLITAEDVAFTFNSVLELVKNHNLGGNWEIMADPEFLDHVEYSGKKVVKFYFKKTGILRVEYGVFMAPVLQKKYWERYVNEVINKGKDIEYLYSVDTIKNPDPASGPFVIKRWEKGAFIELQTVEDYFDRGYTEIHYENGAIVLTDSRGYYWESKEPKGKITLKVEMGPFVDGVIYRVYTERASAIQALLNKEIDMILTPHGVGEGDIKEVKKDPNIVILHSPGANIRYLAFNFRRFPGNVHAFRKAMSYVIDMDFIKGRILKDQVVLTDALVPPTNKFWHNSEVELVDHSLSHVERLKRAYEILKEAGFKWKIEPRFSEDSILREGKGLISPDGKPVKDMILLAPTQSYDPLRATIALYIEKWANEIGIPVKAVYMDFKAILGKVWDEKDFDMYILGWGADITPYHLVSYFKSDSSFNPTGYANSEYDKLCDQIMKADIESAKEIAFKMQKILARDLPFIPLYTPVIIEVYRDYLEFPYIHTFSGLQSVYGLPAYVKKVEKE
ncbi:MAG: ABC transporter substrate-binding protein [Thermotogaceae bacterium]|nr:ABC transporter substrate-binding protein [Thermotogaceae bacterium]